jgi:hypothetical protein
VIVWGILQAYTLRAALLVLLILTRCALLLVGLPGLAWPGGRAGDMAKAGGRDDVSQQRKI